MGVCLPEQLRKHSQPRRHSWDGCQNNPGPGKRQGLAQQTRPRPGLTSRCHACVTAGGKINSPLVWNVCPFSRGTWETASSCREGSLSASCPWSRRTGRLLAERLLSPRRHARPSASQDSGSRLPDGPGLMSTLFCKVWVKG